MTEAFHPRWIEIGRYASRSEADENALALAAIGISSSLVPEETGVGLFVPVADAMEARRELVDYAREDRRGSPRAALRPVSDGLNAALAYCAALVFTYAAAGRKAFGLDFWPAGYAEAGRIVGGEWWRAITALGLHADLGHLAGNIGAGALFGTLLAQSLGPGLAWLAILLAGAAGNAANALVHPAAHTAVGASTAVFAALGLLCALMWRRQATRWVRGLRRWLPLAAGLMLLAFLGTGGERTDVGAHAAGFAAGVVLGAVFDLAGRRIPQGRAAQAAYGVAALGLYGLAWLAAFRIA